VVVLPLILLQLPELRVACFLSRKYSALLLNLQPPALSLRGSVIVASQQSVPAAGVVSKDQWQF
jgi:hypothetical protein